MSYDSSHTNVRFAPYHGFTFRIPFSKRVGWWTDNLQNKDHTLVAGQSGVNDVAVGATPLINDDFWVDITELTDASDLADEALTNEYTCLFNRRRPKSPVDATLNQYLTNVYENNVIPIPPENADVYTYDCTGTTQYTPSILCHIPPFYCSRNN